MRVRAVLLAAMVSASCPVTGLRAERVSSSPMQTFTVSDTYRDLVRRALAAVPPTIFQRCPTLVSNGSRIDILKAVSFAPDGRPNRGVWKHSFPVSGCGNDTILNIYFGAGADERMRIFLGAPGATHADVVLQGDALKAARIAAGSAMKGACQTIIVTNTRFEAYGLSKPPTPDPGADSRLRPWWETWTMTGCDRSFDVPIDFVPDATGTRIIQPGGAVAR